MNISELIKKIKDVALKYSNIKNYKNISDIKSNGEDDSSESFLESEEGDRRSVRSTVSNYNIRNKQQLLLAMVLLAVLLIIVLGFLLLQSKSPREQKAQKPVELNIELADKSLNHEVHWRNHFEDQREQDKREFEERLSNLEEKQSELLVNAKKQLEEELSDTKEKLLMAQKELATAGLALKRVASEEEERINRAPPHMEPAMNEIDFNSNIEFDEPKSVKNYIPEGTYFNGYLLGGIVVSTSINTADENAVPVSIRLESKGNLNSGNDLDVSKCRVMGSAYGDLSSERAVIRLEKMICEVDSSYVTSKIAGIVYGPDGFNGIKGSIVATSSKHINSAMIGGMISGLTSAAKGQEGVSLSAAGVVSTKSHNFKDLATSGLSGGISNAGEKLADYYLKLAESMSPILTIPSGVRIQAHIIKGFYVGEISTHKKIKSERKTDSRSSE